MPEYTNLTNVYNSNGEVAAPSYYNQQNIWREAAKLDRNHKIIRFTGVNSNNQTSSYRNAQLKRMYRDYTADLFHAKYQKLESTEQQSTPPSATSESVDGENDSEETDGSTEGSSLNGERERAASPNFTDKDDAPHIDYSLLVGLAVLNSPDNLATFAEIIDFIKYHIPHYEFLENRWKDSVRRAPSKKPWLNKRWRTTITGSCLAVEIPNGQYDNLHEALAMGKSKFKKRWLRHPDQLDDLYNGIGGMPTKVAGKWQIRHQ